MLILENAVFFYEYALKYHYTVRTMLIYMFLRNKKSQIFFHFSNIPLFFMATLYAIKLIQISVLVKMVGFILPFLKKKF